MKNTFFSNFSFDNFFIRINWHCVSKLPLITSIEIIAKDKKKPSNLNSEKTCIRIEDFKKNLKNYLEGQNFRFDLNILDFSQLTNFQKKVYKELLKVPVGVTCTYKELASKIRNPKASRAIGGAMKRNPFPIVIPCHRVIRSDGKIGNYSGGGERFKRILLGIESHYNS